MSPLDQGSEQDPAGWAPAPLDYLGNQVWVVLGGGGLKGLAHVGAWQALEEAGVKVAGIVPVRVLAQGMLAIHMRVFSIMSWRKRTGLVATGRSPPLLFVRPRLDGFQTFAFDQGGVAGGGAESARRRSLAARQP